MTRPEAAWDGITLFFRQGALPDVAAVLARVAGPGASALLPIGLGHVAPDAGMCELVVAGLSCDLRGLPPASPAAPPAVAHVYGLDRTALADCAAVTLAAGDHVAGGAHLLPVVRALSVAAALLAGMPGCVAVAWPPAASAIAAPLFAGMIAAWIEGGAFPAPGLIAIVADGDDAIVSVGLSFFTGQEIRFDLTTASDKNRIGKIVARLIHMFVESEPVSAPMAFSGPDGQNLFAEPIDLGRIVHIWVGT